MQFRHVGGIEAGLSEDAPPQVEERSGAASPEVLQSRVVRLHCQDRFGDGSQEVGDRGCCVVHFDDSAEGRGGKRKGKRRKGTEEGGGEERGGEEKGRKGRGGERGGEEEGEEERKGRKGGRGEEGKEEGEGRKGRRARKRVRKGANEKRGGTTVIEPKLQPMRMSGVTTKL